MGHTQGLNQDPAGCNGRVLPVPYVGMSQGRETQQPLGPEQQVKSGEPRGGQEPDLEDQP